MAISRCTIHGVEYQRVYRCWGHTPIQRYFSIADLGEERALKKAIEEDESLRSRQRAYEARKVFNLQHHINKDGKLRGVGRVTVKRPGRRPTEAFHMRIKLPWDEKPLRGSVSIDRHGVEGAFDRVVQWYCDHYGFDERSQMRSALRETLGAYTTGMKVKALPETVTSDEDDGWIEQMEKEIEQFKQRDKRAISGR